MQLADAGGVRLAIVKAGSTAAVAVDPSLVVALSPNSPLPAGANVIGNVQITGALPSGNNNIGDVDIVTIPPVEIKNGKTLKSLAIDNGAAAGDFDIIAAVAAKRLKVYAITLQAKAAVDVKVKSPAGDITGPFSLGAREGITLAVTPPAFLFGTVAGDKLSINTSAAVSVVGIVSYYDDDAV